MGKLVKFGVVLLVVLLAFFLLSKRGRVQREPLTAEEQRVWQRFLEKHLSSGMQVPTESDADAVAAIGDKIIPYVEEQFGAAARVPGTYGKSEYWLVVVLGRIGTLRAVDAIVKVLEHDWRGAVGTNREVAAQALVWLGAADRIPALEAAIADHEQIVARSADPPRYAVEVRNLKNYLDLLKKGEGIRDKSKFPFGPSLIDHEMIVLPALPKAP